VISGPFFKKLLHNHFITEFFLKKKSGDVNDQANFSFFFLLHKRAKPVLPPYLLPHSARELKPFTPPLPSPTFRARTQTLYSPLTLSLRPPIRPFLRQCTPAPLTRAPSMRREGIRGGEWGGTVWPASRRLKRGSGNPRPLMRPSLSLWQQRCTLIRLPGAH
jgi:hypothetical protein